MSIHAYAAAHNAIAAAADQSRQSHGWPPRAPLDGGAESSPDGRAIG